MYVLYCPTRASPFPFPPFPNPKGGTQKEKKKDLVTCVPATLGKEQKEDHRKQNKRISMILILISHKILSRDPTNSTLQPNYARTHLRLWEKGVGRPELEGQDDIKSCRKRKKPEAMAPSPYLLTFFFFFLNLKLNPQFPYISFVPEIFETNQPPKRKKNYKKGKEKKKIREDFFFSKKLVAILMYVLYCTPL